MTGQTAVRRTVATVTVLITVTAAFVAGFLVSDAGNGEKPAYRLTAAGLDNGLSCDRLLQWYVDHGLDQVTAWGWQEPMYRLAIPMEGAIPQDSTGSAPEASLDTQTGSNTGTNVQEAGVDEPDIAKASGDLLVRIGNGLLMTDDVSGTEPRRLGVAPLDRIGDPQLLLSGDRAIVIGTEVEDPAAGAPLFPARSGTWVRTYDLSDPSDPTLAGSRLYDGSLVTARQIGSTVRLVLDGGLPVLDFETPSSSISEQAALSHNRDVVRSSTIQDWLPRVTAYDGAESDSVSAVDCASVAVPETFNGLGTLTVVGFDPATPGTADATGVATVSDTAYMSATHLYVATSPWPRVFHPIGGPMTMPRDVGAPTRIYAFDLSDTSARYVGMGSVDGTVGGSWSMDEHAGALRVAVATPSGSTSIVLFRPASGRLLDVGRLDGLGAGQQLKSVRWFDDLAVLVTFRQIDPFYLVDLADASNPRVLGELHLPGWSSYLHPVGPHLILGLGQGAPGGVVLEPPMPVPPTKGFDPGKSGTVEGLNVPVTTAHPKATLFDISDPTHPRDIDTVTYHATGMAMAGVQPHQVTWLPDRHVLLTVLSGSLVTPGWEPQATRPIPPAWLSVLTVHDGSLANRMVAVPEATDVNDVRTLALSDGRVVLVAGDSVRFLTV